MDGDRVTAENLNRSPPRPLRPLLFYHHLVPTMGGGKMWEEGREVRWRGIEVRVGEGGEREYGGRGEEGERGKIGEKMGGICEYSILE